MSPPATPIVHLAVDVATTAATTAAPPGTVSLTNAAAEPPGCAAAQPDLCDHTPVERDTLSRELPRNIGSPEQ